MTRCRWRLDISAKIAMYSLSVLLLCKSVRRARSVVKTLQPAVGGDLKETEQIVSFSSGTGTEKPCRDETGPECMCWTDRLLCAFRQSLDCTC